jgi:hypothetical protein
MEATRSPYLVQVHENRRGRDFAPQTQKRCGMVDGREDRGARSNARPMVPSDSCTFTLFLKFKRPAQELTVLDALLD